MKMWRMKGMADGVGCEKVTEFLVRLFRCVV